MCKYNCLRYWSVGWRWVFYCCWFYFVRLTFLLSSIGNKPLLTFRLGVARCHKLKFPSQSFFLNQSHADMLLLHCKSTRGLKTIHLF